MRAINSVPVVLCILAKMVVPADSCATGSNGITSCSGRSDGYYQSCQGCNMYATCSGGRLYDNRPCSTPLVWDDTVKACVRTSSTCSLSDSTTSATTAPPCETGIRGTSTCAGRPDGEYQSCQGCDVYIVCANNMLYDNRPCPMNLIWDDNVKRCLPSSSTCTPTDGGGPVTEPPLCYTGPRGVQSCQGLPSGFYQSCRGCDVYVSCANGILTDDRPCPSGQVWDDDVKGCLLTSTTCPMAYSTLEPMSSTVVVDKSFDTKNSNKASGKQIGIEVVANPSRCSRH